MTEAWDYQVMTDVMDEATADLVCLHTCTELRQLHPPVNAQST